MNIRRCLIYVCLLLIVSCKNGTDISIQDCKICNPDDTNYLIISGLLNKEIDDSILHKEFSVLPEKSSYILKDIRNKWEQPYSLDYFDIIVKAYTDEYVLIYCPYSGIMAGYNLLPKKDHDVFLIDRKAGKVVKHIVIKRGLANALIYNKCLYLKFVDPSEVRECEF